MVKKFNAPVPDEIRIFMALYRVKNKSVDLLLVMNVPLTASDGGAINEGDISTSQEEFEAAVQSLRIVDFGLFA